VAAGREFIRAFYPQYFGIFKKRLFELFGEIFQWHFGFARAADRLIIHIGDVHYPVHLVSAQLQVPLQ